MKRIAILLICVFLSLSAARSQDSARISLAYPVYSQYLQNGMMINPAYTGSRGALSAFLSYRMQMMGMDGSPVIQSASLHTPLKNDHVALGLIAQFMQYGVTRSSSIYATYAYHIRLAKGKLSFGLKGGFDRSNTDYTGILQSLSDMDDPVFISNDKPYMLPNVSAGVYYWSNKFFAGFSVPAFLSYSRTPTGSVQAYHNFNNYDLMFSAGGLISFSDFFKFKPSILADYSLNSANKLSRFDINGNFILADLIWIGGSWRTTEEVAVGILQVQVNQQLMFGFSYDYPVGHKEFFSKGLNGSSEFILRYEFGYKVSASNPRYF
ncbi:MAG TPA: PorP/SprF family type IX secretion system membrane protein [Bacteroidales bacterium]|jgi:type IX secretion system PorP/SprF family membrane protein|nr:PorP/SprF family type IX secretion system membrane protein [Bacteroidales bacterium]